MNAAIRSVVRYSLHYGIEVAGIMRGYQGLLDNVTCSGFHQVVCQKDNVPTSELGQAVDAFGGVPMRNFWAGEIMYAVSKSES